MGYLTFQDLNRCKYEIIKEIHNSIMEVAVYPVEGTDSLVHVDIRIYPDMFDFTFLSKKDCFRVHNQSSQISLLDMAMARCDTIVQESEYINKNIFSYTTKNLIALCKLDRYLILSVDVCS